MLAMRGRAFRCLEQCNQSLVSTLCQPLKPYKSANGLKFHIVEAMKIELGMPNELAVFGRHTGTIIATKGSMGTTMI